MHRLDRLPTDPKREQEKQLDVTVISPDESDKIADYYNFEVAQGFSKVDPHNPSRTLEAMVRYRQQQLRDGKIGIAIGRIGDRVAATSAVALESGTMDRVFKEDEAWAVGTVVDPELRNQGIGLHMSEEQDRMARGAGKNFLRTKIYPGNSASMRLRMNKAGYILEAVEDEHQDDDPEHDGYQMYLYRKDLRKGQAPEGELDINWVDEVAVGRVAPPPGSIDEKSPDRVLVEPWNQPLVRMAVDQGYRGVHLLRPEDFGEEPPIDRSYVVFSRKPEADRRLGT